MAEVAPGADLGLHGGQARLHVVVAVQRFFAVVEAIADEKAHLGGRVAGSDVLAVAAARCSAVDFTKTLVSHINLGKCGTFVVTSVLAFT